MGDWDLARKSQCAVCIPMDYCGLESSETAEQVKKPGVTGVAGVQEFRKETVDFWSADSD